ncbi:MAG: type II secretion system F family protein [Patescibacteria group bacterium]
MPHFKFKAKKSSGETYSAERDAQDRYELYRMIKEGGDEILTATEKREGRFHMKLSGVSIGGKVKAIEKVNFARNLGSMLDAGLPLSRALSVLERQSRNKKFKEVLTGVMSDINKGTTFAEALGKYPKVFAAIFLSMVHAGEQSGTLADSLKAVGVQLDRAYALERRIKGALIYPAVIICVMIIIAILMFVFVVPTLMKTFTELNVELPLPTRVVLGISNIIQHQGIWVLLAVIVIGFVLTTLARKPAGKKVVHSLVLKIPLIGLLVQEVNTARTSRTLSSLLNAGVNVLESVTITAEVIQNVHFRDVLIRASEAIKKGKPMSDVFGENIKLYPVFFSEMMKRQVKRQRCFSELQNITKRMLSKRPRTCRRSSNLSSWS